MLLLRELETQNKIRRNRLDVQGGYEHFGFTKKSLNTCHVNCVIPIKSHNLQIIKNWKICLGLILEFTKVIFGSLQCTHLLSENADLLHLLVRRKSQKVLNIGSCPEMVLYSFVILLICYFCL